MHICFREIDKSFSPTRQCANVRSLILYSYLLPILLLFFPVAAEVRELRRARVRLNERPPTLSTRTLLSLSVFFAISDARYITLMSTISSHRILGLLLPFSQRADE